MILPKFFFFFSRSSFGLGLLRGLNSLRSSSRIRAPESLGLCFFWRLELACFVCTNERCAPRARHQFLTFRSDVFGSEGRYLRTKSSGRWGEADLSGPSYMSTALLYTDGSTLVRVPRQWGGTRKLCSPVSAEHYESFYPSVLTSLVGCFPPFPPLYPAFVCTPAKWSGDRSFTSQGLKR